MERKILLLGDPALYEVSEPVKPEEAAEMRAVSRDLHDTLMAFRAKHACGRAVAAPQIGVRRRLIYMCTDKPVTFINPTLEFPDDELFEVMDDCMSFPGLLVKVTRHKRCVIHYTDLDWNERSMALSDSVSELLQHEYDHLDGILAVQRAIDDKSFFVKGA